MKREDLVRTIAAVVLCMAIWLVWMFYFAPKPGPQQPAGAKGPVAAAAPAPGAQQPAAPAASAGAPAAGQAAAAPANAAGYVRKEGDPAKATTEIRTATQHIVLSAHGGEVRAWELLGFPQQPDDPKGGPVNLVSSEAAEQSRLNEGISRLPLHVVTGDDALDRTLTNALCVVDESAPGAEELRARNLPASTQKRSFTWADGQGLELTKTLYVPEDDRYLSVFEWSLTKAGQPIQSAALWWGPSIGQLTEHAGTSGYYRGAVYFPSGNGTGELFASKQKADASIGAPRWFAITDQYFAVAMIPADTAPTLVRVDRPGQPQQALAVQTSAHRLTLFTGPKQTKLLKRLDAQLGTSLQQLVPWGMWGFLAQPLHVALGWAEGLVHNWGWAIVLVTVLIRLAFFPLTQRSMVKMRRSQEQMSRLKPKMDRLREKYRGQKDMEARRKMNEEMMELYRKEGINPMAQLSGCLPMLLQLPVLFAFYKVLTVAIELRGAPFFGWIRDLSAMDPYYITPIVMGVTMLVQQVMAMTKTQDPQAKQQQRMMLIIPLIFLWSFRNMPSGLVIYWLVSNLLSIAQQVLINRQAAQVPVAVTTK